MRGSRPSGFPRGMARRSLEVETVAKPSEAQTPRISKVGSASNSVQQPPSGFTGLLLCSFLWGERMRHAWADHCELSRCVPYRHSHACMLHQSARALTCMGGDR